MWISSAPVVSAAGGGPPDPHVGTLAVDHDRAPGGDAGAARHEPDAAAVVPPGQAVERVGITVGLHGDQGRLRRHHHRGVDRIVVVDHTVRGEHHHSGAAVDGERGTLRADVDVGVGALQHHEVAGRQAARSRCRREVGDPTPVSRLWAHRGARADPTDEVAERSCGRSGRPRWSGRRRARRCGAPPSAAITRVLAGDGGRRDRGERRRDVETHPPADGLDRRRRAALDAAVGHRRRRRLRRRTGARREVRGDERRRAPTVPASLAGGGSSLRTPSSPLRRASPSARLPNRGGATRSYAYAARPNVLAAASTAGRDGRCEQRVAGDLQRLGGGGGADDGEVARGLQELAAVVARCALSGSGRTPDVTW